MTTTQYRAKLIADRFRSVLDLDRLIDRIRNKTAAKEPEERLHSIENDINEGRKRRLSFLDRVCAFSPQHLSGHTAITDYNQFQGNIENFIGLTQIPTAVVGPLKIVGSAAEGDFFVPLATTEGALVASYHRGCRATYLAGGVTSVCLTEGVQRCPVFKFKDLADAGIFLFWIIDQLDRFEEIVSATSHHAKLADVSTNTEGNQIVVTFDFETGDASGQNMVTICTDAICRYIVSSSPVTPLSWFIESNYSGDKKATAYAFSHVRGKKVTAEIELSKEILHQVLNTDASVMQELWCIGTLAVMQSGAIGAQGHFANGLAAVFLATGQDVACVSEAATGITRMERIADDGLYASVTLPNLIVGTVGGGTHLPTQNECLELMGCAGTGKARKYAEICGGLILAGELSITASIAGGNFVRAHQLLGRRRGRGSK